MKYLVRSIKRVCIGIFSIYSINVLFGILNIVVPINLYTISMSSIFGIFGLFGIIVLKLVI